MPLVFKSPSGAPVPLPAPLPLTLVPLTLVTFSSFPFPFPSSFITPLSPSLPLFLLLILFTKVLIGSAGIRGTFVGKLEVEFDDAGAAVRWSGDSIATPTANFIFNTSFPSSTLAKAVFNVTMADWTVLPFPRPPLILPFSSSPLVL